MIKYTRMMEENFDEMEYNFPAENVLILDTMNEYAARWIKADLTTFCKKPKTAVKRLFEGLKNSGVTTEFDVFNGWEEQLFEMLESGETKLHEKDEFHFEIEEIDDDYFYIFFNLRVK